MEEQRTATSKQIVPIVVVSRDPAARKALQLALCDMGKRPDDDFVIVSTLGHLEGHIVPKERQVLILGSLWADPTDRERKTAEIIYEARKLNKEVAVISYSRVHHPDKGPYDLVIPKRDPTGISFLQLVVRNFFDEC